MLNQSLYIFTSKMAGYAVRLVVPYFLVRLLTVGEFGAYRQYFLLEMYITSLFQLGLNQALYYFIPRDTRNAGAYFLNVLVLNAMIFTIAFALILAVLDPLSNWLKMEVLRQNFWLLFGNVLILMMVVAGDCYLTARQKIKAAALFEVAGQTLMSVACLAAAYYTHRLDAILAALLAARAVQMVAMLAYIHVRLHGFRAERYFFGIREQIRYGVVLGAGGTLFTVLMKLNEFFVSHQYGTEVYAIYSAGCTDIPLVRIFTQSVAVVSLGQFAIMEKQGDWTGIRRVWDRVLASSYAITLPVVIVLVVVSDPLIRFMFTDKYAGAIQIFQVASLMKIAMVFNATLVLRAMSRNDITIWINVISLVAAVPLLYAGMKLGGLVGIMVAQAVLLLGNRVGAVFWMNRIIPVRLPYFVGVRELWAFYGEAWNAAKARLGRGAVKHVE